MNYISNIRTLAVLGGLAGLLGGCAAGNAAAKDDDHDYARAGSPSTETAATAVSPYQEALQSLNEQGAVIDDTLQCTTVSSDYFLDEFKIDEIKRKAESAALEKIISARGEQIVERYRSNQQRRFVTVKSKESNSTIINTYAYTLVNSWEAYGGAREYFCVQSSAPSDLLLISSGDHMDIARLQIRQAHDTDVVKAKLEMKERGKAAEEMLRQQDKATKKIFEEMRLQREERTTHYRQGSQDGVETYHREHQQERREWYEQHGAPATPQPVTPQNPSKVNPQQEKTQPEALPPSQPESGDEPTKGYRQTRQRILDNYERTREEIRLQFERDREEIHRQHEKERKKILGE